MSLAGRSPCFVMCGDDICRDHGCRHVYKRRNNPPPEPVWVVPWTEQTAPGRVPPRLCVVNARDALNRAYGLTGPAPYPLLIEAVDWLRRALEQMAPPNPAAVERTQE